MPWFARMSYLRRTRRAQATMTSSADARATVDRGIRRHLAPRQLRRRQRAPSGMCPAAGGDQSRQDSAAAESSLASKIGVAGSEPTTSRSRKRALYQAELHPVRRQSTVAYGASTMTRRRGPWTPSTRSNPMSDVADGPETRTIGRPSRADGARRSNELRHRLDDLTPARTTHTWRSGTSVIARRPWPGPPSSANVPVSAQADGACRHRAVERVELGRRRDRRRRRARRRRAGASGSRSGGTTDPRRAVLRERVDATAARAASAMTTHASRASSTPRDEQRRRLVAPGGAAHDVVARRRPGTAPSASACRIRAEHGVTRLAHVPPTTRGTSAAATPGSVRERAPARERPREASGAGRRARAAAGARAPSAARARSARRSRTRARAARSARPSTPGRALRTTFARSWTRIRGMSIPHRADVRARAAERRGVRQRRGGAALAGRAAAAGSRRSGRHRPCRTRGRRSGGRPGRR